MTSSIYPQEAILNADPGAGTNIIQTSISITDEMVRPGGGGILRLYFAFIFGVTPSTVTVFNNEIAKGTLNADNSSEVVTSGYYRFDIDVESGDAINLRADSGITTTGSFVRAHLVQFGA